MNIKDYLHLYLGCEIRYTPLQNEYFDEVITGVNDWKVFVDGDNEHACTVDDCKLILRPLSDMTEEEKQEAFLSRGNGDGFSNNVPEAHEFLYLLSKHFDLFGLIDAGLAIDKTKQLKTAI